MFATWECQLLCPRIYIYARAELYASLIANEMINGFNGILSKTLEDLPLLNFLGFCTQIRSSLGLENYIKYF